MDRWLQAALDYIPTWLALQMRVTRRPGVALAINDRQQTVLDLALGHANLSTGRKLSTRHRFRIASHSKSFTAAGILRLREQGLLKLDDRVGEHVQGLHPQLAQATLAQLLSHSAGVTRDGPDAGQFQDRRPFLSRDELLAQLREAPSIAPNLRLKYSNHGYALLGLAIESCTQESYATWMQREIIDRAGLQHTQPDAQGQRTPWLASGHSGEALLGQRVLIPCDQPTHAIAPAGGFVSTAADLAAFYAQLLPDARHSVLSPDSRREMQRRHWSVPHSAQAMDYGLGLMRGTFHGWEWVGHTGGLQGFVSRSVALPEQNLAISLLCNSLDGLSWPWVDGVLQILQTFARHGAPSARTRGWSGRFWNLWGATDLVPVKDRILAISPALVLPFTDATELTPTGPDTALATQANGFAGYGEPARLVRDGKGKVRELWLGGSRSLTERAAAREMRRRYGTPMADAEKNAGKTNGD